MNFDRLRNEKAGSRVNERVTDRKSNEENSYFCFLFCFCWYLPFSLFFGLLLKILLFILHPFILFFNNKIKQCILLPNNVAFLPFVTHALRTMSWKPLSLYLIEITVAVLSITGIFWIRLSSSSIKRILIEGLIAMYGILVSLGSLLSLMVLLLSWLINITCAWRYIRAKSVTLDKHDWKFSDDPRIKIAVSYLSLLSGIRRINDIQMDVGRHSVLNWK